MKFSRHLTEIGHVMRSIGQQLVYSWAISPAAGDALEQNNPINAHQFLILY